MWCMPLNTAILFSCSWTLELECNEYGLTSRGFVLLRLAGYGPKAANVVGLTDQTDLNTTIASALKLPSRLPRR